MTADNGAEMSTHTKELLDDIKAYLARFVVYPSQHELNAHTLWIGHAWLMDCWESTPGSRSSAPSQVRASPVRSR